MICYQYPIKMIKCLYRVLLNTCLLTKSSIAVVVLLFLTLLVINSFLSKRVNCINHFAHLLCWKLFPATVTNLNEPVHVQKKKINLKLSGLWFGLYYLCWPQGALLLMLLVRWDTIDGKRALLAPTHWLAGAFAPSIVVIGGAAGGMSGKIQTENRLKCKVKI